MYFQIKTTLKNNHSHIIKHHFILQKICITSIKNFLSNQTEWKLKIKLKAKLLTKFDKSEINSSRPATTNPQKKKKKSQSNHQL